MGDDEREPLTEPEFNRWGITLRDWESARRFVKAARENDDPTVREALLIAAIIAYYRPFSPNEKTPKKSDPPPKATSRIDVASFTLSPGQVVIHNRLHTLRNKAIAHAEFGFYPTRISRETSVVHSRTYSVLHEDLDLDAFEGLLDSLIEQNHDVRHGFVQRHRRGETENTP